MEDDFGEHEADRPANSIVARPADPANNWQQRAAEYEEAKVYKGSLSYQRFISVLAATGTISFSARMAGHSVKSIQRRREHYPEFDEAITRALEYFSSAILERAAISRAVDGVDKAVFHKGFIVGYERVYSDSLMKTLLAGHMPEKYRSKSENTSGAMTVIIKGGLPEPGSPMAMDLPEEELPLPPQPIDRNA